MLMPPSESFVRSTLGPFEQRLRTCIDRAWADYLTISIRHKFRFTRTRANIVFDLIAGNVLVELDETIKLLVDDVLLLRIKKANEAGLGSNISTQAVIELVSQEPEIPRLLPDLHKI
jgi:hypothetical protein